MVVIGSKKIKNKKPSIDVQESMARTSITSTPNVKKLCFFNLKLYFWLTYVNKTYNETFNITLFASRHHRQGNIFLTKLVTGTWMKHIIIAKARQYLSCDAWHQYMDEAYYRRQGKAISFLLCLASVHG